jgi:hypothetical protein
MAKGGNPSPVKPPPGKGRPKGAINHATRTAREAISRFVDGNADKLEGWLEEVANGDPENGIKPNPAKAFELFQSVVEYHVPKLARTEVTGVDGGPVQVTTITRKIVDPKDGT